VTNFQISKPAFAYVPVYGQNVVTNYPNASLPLLGVYYEYGEPIMLSYKINGTTPKTPRIIITTEMLSEGSESNAVISGKNLYTPRYAQGNITANTEAYRSLPEGSYKIHYVNGKTFQNCVNYVEPIGINVAPVVTLKASVGGTSVLNSDDCYDNQYVNSTISVTEADVANGYVTVKFTFVSLKASTNYYLTVDNVSLVKQ
jgi:hypothetical protein